MWDSTPGPDATDAPTPSPGPADLEDPLGEARLLRELLQVLGVGVVVNGKVRLHGPKLVVLEGGAHALRLLAARVRLVAVQVLRIVLIAAQGWGRNAEAAGEPPGPDPHNTAKSTPTPRSPNVSSLRTTGQVPHPTEMEILSHFIDLQGSLRLREPSAQGHSARKCWIQTQL